MSNETDRSEIDVDIARGTQEEYAALLKEARKQAREAAEKAPRKASRNIWVENDTVHWEVRMKRFTGKWIALGILLLPLTVVYSIFILPFQGFTKVWARGSFPLPNNLDVD